MGVSGKAVWGKAEHTALVAANRISLSTVTAVGFAPYFVSRPI